MTFSFGCSHFKAEQKIEAERKIAQEDEEEVLDKEIDNIRDNSRPTELFTDSEGRKWVKLYNWKVEQTVAKKYCKKQGMKLPSKALVEKLNDELVLKAKEGLISDWFWTGSVYSEKAWSVFIFSSGEVSFQKFWTDARDMQVICVSKE